jgi:hypothetical protein
MIFSVSTSPFSPSVTRVASVAFSDSSFDSASGGNSEKMDPADMGNKIGEPTTRVADSIVSVDPDPDSESGSGSSRAKMTHKSRKKINKFMF